MDAKLELMRDGGTESCLLREVWQRESKIVRRETESDMRLDRKALLCDDRRTVRIRLRILSLPQPRSSAKCSRCGGSPLVKPLAESYSHAGVLWSGPVQDPSIRRRQQLAASKLLCGASIAACP